MATSFLSYSVPLVGQSRADLDKAEFDSRANAVVKPQRQLGAVYVDGLIARRRIVSMCEACWRKYANWWKYEGYHGDWDERYRGDCDGCSTMGIYITPFAPEENFYRVFTERHGRKVKP